MGMVRCWLIVLSFGLFFVAACTGPEPTPTATPTPTVTTTPTPTATPTLAPTLTPTPTLEPTVTFGPLGTLKQVADVECRSFFGDQCKTAVVSCLGIGDAMVRLRLTGAGTKGTVLLVTGGNGTGFYAGEIYSGSNFANTMLETLVDDGYKLVEIAWTPPGVWEGPGGSVSLACRAATVFDWVHKDVHRGGLFVAQGNSGGSAQIAFSLAYYGLDAILDLVNLSGGPPPCPISTDGNINFQEQQLCLVGSRDWDRSKEPMLSGKPRLHYPNTIVRFFLGENEPTAYIIETAKAYHDAITSEKSLQIVPNTGHNVQQTREGAEALIASIRQARSRLTQASEGRAFVCTTVIGGSQTDQWYRGAPDFESVVDNDRWQLLARGGGAIDRWSDPGYVGWATPIFSPCLTGSASPDQVVFTISNPGVDREVAAWAGAIRAAIATLRNKYPSVVQIALQPMVGGPNHQLCPHPDQGVIRASSSHPVIDEAIGMVVGGDVVAGASPEVRTCNDYSDGVGHLKPEAQGPVGRSIALFYRNW